MMNLRIGLLLIVNTVACGLGDNPSTSSPSLFITRVSGNAQKGVQGILLSGPLVVLVTDKQGQPVSKQRVDFEVISGDAAVVLESSVSDTNGLSSTRVQLGNKLGENVVRASIFSQDAATEFTLTTLESGPPPNVDEGNVSGPNAFLVTSTSGDLVIELLEGEGLGEVEFGMGTPATGTSKSERDVIFTVHLDFSEVSVNPSPIVNKGFFPAGSVLNFYGTTDFRGLRYWAFSSHLGGNASPSDAIMFMDTDNSLGKGGSVVDTVGVDHWILHLDDAASICCDDDDNELIVGVRIE